MNYKAIVTWDPTCKEIREVVLASENVSKAMYQKISEMAASVSKDLKVDMLEVCVCKGEKDLMKTELYEILQSLEEKNPS